MRTFMLLPFAAQAMNPAAQIEPIEKTGIAAPCSACARIRTKREQIAAFALNPALRKAI